MRKRTLAIICIFLIVQPFASAQVDMEYDRKGTSVNYTDIMIKQFFQYDNTPGIVSYTNAINSQDTTFSGINQGLGLVTLMRLFDLYNDTYLLNFAKSLSDFVSTNLIDIRYDHLATYYDGENELISNYRSVVDNFMAAWGLDMLVQRIDPEDRLTKKDHQDTLDWILDDLDAFIEPNQFLKEKRVDVETVSTNFDVYSNLMTSFIITESGSEIFSEYLPTVNKIYNNIKQNISTGDGGVYSLYKFGFHDDLVTLRNTALFANLALNLYQSTQETNYLADAIESIDFINNEFYDIGVTGGYVEAIVDGTPVQQSKSLFSHAILLLSLIKLVNAGEESYDLDLFGLWNTINKYFKSSTNEFYFSTITRNGESASNTISVQDNLMMLLALTFVPVLIDVEYNSEVEYRDEAQFTLKYQVPENFGSKLYFSYTDSDGEYIEDVIDLEGEQGVQEVLIKISPPRPVSDLLEVDFKMELDTLGIITDSIYGSFDVRLESGIDLSLEVITVFSIIAILTFVMFVNRVTKVLDTPTTTTEKK